MKSIKVKFAGIEVAKPHEGNLTIYYIPDQTQTLMAGEKYKVIIEGLSFAHEDTGRGIQECIRWKGKSGSATHYCIGAKPNIDCPPPHHGCEFSQFKPVYHRMQNKLKHSTGSS